MKITKEDHISRNLVLEVEPDQYEETLKTMTKKGFKVVLFRHLDKKIECHFEKVWYSDIELEILWSNLTDVPFDYPEDTGLDDMALAEDWFIFKKGTEREDIWRWFDAQHTKGVAWLLYESDNYNKHY